MKTENEVLARFLQMIFNELAEQRGIPCRVTCKVGNKETPQR